MSPRSSAALHESQDERLAVLIGHDDPDVAVPLAGALRSAADHLASERREAEPAEQRAVVTLDLLAEQRRRDHRLAQAVGAAQAGPGRKLAEWGRDVAPRARLEPGVER